MAAAPWTDYAGSVERLSRERILRALSALSDELERAGARVDLAVGGGAALVLLYGARESTKDVDAFALDPAAWSTVAAAAVRVSESLGLPDDWLNDAAKGYVQGIALGETIFDSGPLKVQALAPAQLLAILWEADRGSP